MIEAITCCHCLHNVSISVDSVNIELYPVFKSQTNAARKPVMTRYHHGNLRQALIDQAIETIGTSGVEGLSLRQVARDLEVSHSAPARHFKSKADLLSAIVAESYSELTKTVYDGLAATGAASASATLNKVARDAMQWALAHPTKFSVMTNPDVARFANDDIKKSLSAFANAISAAIGAANSDDAPQSSAHNIQLLFVIGTVLGVSTLLTDELMRTTIGDFNDEEAIGEIADMIFAIGKTET